jgi:predicted AAA+ superfamily ATPase
MKRIITQKLGNWKTGPDRKPLIIRGPRQTGKSYSIIEFGKDYFAGNLHIVNFEKQPDWKSIFEKNLDALRILSELEIVINKRIVPGRDLLFFDEIQACPKAIAALRYFNEQIPALHLIAAGSLLEFALKDIPFPVGRVQLLNMHPMNFYEFLLATGKDLVAECIINEPVPLSESVHSLLRDELRKYFFVGGMPECVKVFAGGRSVAQVMELQSDLLETFRNDFPKYAGHSDLRCLSAVLSSVSQKVGRQIKYSHLAEGFSNPTIKKAFDLLETARMFRKVRAASPAGLPLGASAAENKFKIIMLDIGLLARLSGLPVSTEFHNDNLLSLFKGAMAEQFVGQELLASGHEELFYWSREAKSSSAETDFLTEIDDAIVPVEVKSGATGSLKSLHLLLKTYHNVDRAIIFSDTQVGTIPEQKLYFYPLYFAAAALKKSKN